MNERQITGGNNGSDKIEENRGNISAMINLRFGAQALLLNPEARRKAERVYHWRNLPQLKDNKWGPRPGYEYFSGGSSELQNDFLTPDFNWIVFSLFLSFIQLKNVVINLDNPNTIVQSPFFVVHKALY